MELFAQNPPNNQNRVENVNQPQTLMAPQLINPLIKREAFSVSLRKKKRNEILGHKREKIQKMIEMKANGSLITEEESAILLQLHSEVQAGQGEIDPILENLVALLKNGSPQLNESISLFQQDLDGSRQMEKDIWRKAPDLYFKRATAWLKHVRQQFENRQFFEKLLISSRFVDFLKLNLVLVRDSVG